MEHKNHRNKLLNIFPSLSLDQIEKLLGFAILVFEYNHRFNLTGCKTLEAVIDVLIIDSLSPFDTFNVPHGTSFVDIGTGSGIPGIPVGIVYSHFSGLLIDSNHKKCDFIARCINDLSLNNLSVSCGRVEDFGHDASIRESFDHGFCRAFANIYSSVELLFPFIKPNGSVFIYSNETHASLSSSLLSHISSLGGSLVPISEYPLYGFRPAGILFKKLSSTPDKYPRRFSVISRASNH